MTDRNRYAEPRVTSGGASPPPILSRPEAASGPERDANATFDRFQALVAQDAGPASRPAEPRAKASPPPPSQGARPTLRATPSHRTPAAPSRRRVWLWRVQGAALAALAAALLAVVALRPDLIERLGPLPF
jgi:ferric-dicitrate binding protein FerR (iron transport regulator)